MTKKPNLNPPRWKEGLKMLKRHRVLLILLLLGLYNPAMAQSGTEKITLNLKNATLAEFAKEIKAQAGYAFFYNDSTAKAIEPITVSVRNATLSSVLDMVIAKKEGIGSLSGSYMPYAIIYIKCIKFFSQIGDSLYPHSVIECLHGAVRA